MTERRILLRLDADHQIGLGHAVRVGALLEAVRGFRIVGCGAGATLPDLLPRVAEWVLPEQGARLLGAGAYDALWVDHPEPEAPLLAAARRRGLPIVRIDDFGFRGEARLVINGSPGASPRLYPDVASERVLSGPRHALLRPEFPSARDARRPSEGFVVCVVGSGAGALPFARALVGAAARRSGGRLDLVIGASFPEDPALEATARAAGVRLHRGLGAGELAALLSTGALAVTTGGMIVSECLAVGVPLLAHAQVDSVAGELRWLEDRGTLRTLGPDDARDSSQLARRIEETLADPGAPIRARRGLDLVDGRGVERVAEAIDAALSSGIQAVEEVACASP